MTRSAAGAGADTIYAGDGSDTIAVSDGFGADLVEGGEDADLSETDLLDASGVTLSGVNVVLTADEAGTLSAGADTVTFSQIEAFTLTQMADLFDGSAVSAPVSVSGGARGGYADRDIRR